MQNEEDPVELAVCTECGSPDIEELVRMRLSDGEILESGIEGVFCPACGHDFGANVLLVPQGRRDAEVERARMIEELGLVAAETA